VSELTQEEKIRANRACNGDKTVTLSKDEATYCLKRMRADGKLSSEIAKVLGLSAFDIDRWIIAGRALGGRPASKPPESGEELPQTISEKIQNRDRFEVTSEDPLEFVKLPAEAPPPQVEEIAPGQITAATPRTHIAPTADPLIAAALDVRRTATACAEAERAHHAAVERLQDEISAVRFPDAESVFAQELAAEESAVLAYDPSEKVDLAAVRTWAQEQGIPVSPVGRIKAEVIERYREAVGS
jgi:Lsr2